MEIEDFEVLLKENPAQLIREFAKYLEVDHKMILIRLQALGKVNKKDKWVLHMLSEWAILNNMCFPLLWRDNERSFLSRIVTGDEKRIYFDNPNRKWLWVNPNETVPSIPRRNIHSHKVLLWVWWDEKAVIYYKFLTLRQIVTAEVYNEQIRALDATLLEKTVVICLKST